MITPQGGIFRQKMGKEFTYSARSDTLFPSATSWHMPGVHVAAAIDRMPVSGPGELQDFYGPPPLNGIQMGGGSARKTGRTRFN